MTTPDDFAARVLAGLARGRAEAIKNRRAEAAPLERAVRREMDLDALSGKPERGRAVRIARRLRLRERHVRKILARLSSWADSSGSTAPQSAEEHHP